MRLALRLLRVPLILLALVLLVGGATYVVKPSWLLQANVWRQANAAHLDRHTLQVGESRWSYYEGGEGPTLILLHGLATDSSLWLPVAKQLSPHFHVVIPDLPGWGQSSPIAGGDVGVSAQAQRLQAFVQTLGVGRAVFIGQGFGGAIAGVYAVQHPQQVTALVLVDSFGLKAKPTPFTQALQAGKDPYAETDRSQFQALLQTLFVQPPSVPGRIMDVFIARNQTHRAFMHSLWTRLRQPEQGLALQNVLGQLSVPVLAVWGHDDKIIDPSALESLRQGLTHASTISTSVINECGHLPPLEKPQALAQIITGFVIAH
ncbi:MAG: alpha/beta fold hydrolase [Xanthomonadales bacterium]|nr:alpha/beta fold hydrolase [Xanthomonadales bacterium]